MDLRERRVIEESDSDLNGSTEWTNSELAMEPGLDRLCLAFCISFHDHDVRGDFFESVGFGFLAVHGIDKARTSLKRLTISRQRYLDSSRLANY